MRVREGMEQGIVICLKNNMCCTLICIIFSLFFLVLKSEQEEK